MDKVKQVLTPKSPDADDISIKLDTNLDNLPKIELKTIFEEVIYKGLQKVVAGLTILFFVVTIVDLCLLPKSVISIVVPVSLSITIICGILAFVLPKTLISIKVANTIGASLSILAIIHSLLIFYLLAEPRQIIGIILILIASSSLLVSLEWLIAVTLVAVFGWAMVMWLTNQPDWLRSGLLIFCSAIISYLVFITRIYTLNRLETLNLKYQARKVQLEEVLAEKEKTNLELEQTLGKLKNSREDLKVLINSINGIVWEADINLSQFLFVSKKVEKILGYLSSRWLEEKGFWLSHIHPEDKEKVLMYTTSEIKYGRDYELEYRMIAADGNTVWLRDIVTVVFENERVSKLQGVMFDITDRKKVEAALIRSENRYRDLFEKANDIIYTHDLSGRFISINGHAEELLGYSREEMLTLNINQILIPEQLGRVRERMKRRLAGEILPSHELALKAKNGRQIIFEISSWLEWENDVPIAIHGIARDITERKQIEEALKESEERYKSLFNTAPIGIYRSTPEGKILDANATAIKMMGCSSLAELVERDLEKDGMDANYSRKEFKETLEKQGQIIGFEAEWNTRKGEKRFIRENASAIKNSNGKVLYYDGTIEDISKRKEIEEALRTSEKQYRLLFENNPCPCFVYDVVTLKFLAANKAAIQHYGYTLDELTSMTIKDIRPAEDVAKVLGFLSEGNHQVFQSKHWRHRKKDGTVFDVEITSDDAIFESKQARLVLARDITERKQTEELLKIARDNALESAKFKSQFLANISHEIRTPLNGVIGMTYLLLDTKLTEKQKEYIEIIHNCGDSLLALINDILDLAKIESGKLHFEQIDFDLKILVDDVIKIFSSKIESKQLNLYLYIDKNIPMGLTGDPNRLSQILINLISNALKFTNKGNIKVNIKLDQEIEDITKIRFEVIDTGIGISLETINKLFQPFVQADSSTTRQFGGTGLGLAICKQLVEGMGGDIGVDSSLGIGSTFWFTIKLIKQSNTLLKPSLKKQSFEILREDKTNSNNDNKELVRVLLVEDNLVNQSVASNILGKLGCSVDIVDNGLTALGKLLVENYDLILMDCQMPIMDGYETTMAIRTQEAKNNKSPIPIIALTAGAMEEDRKRCLESGMDDYIIKPFKPSEIDIILKKWLDKSWDPFELKDNHRNFASNLKHPKELITLDINILTELISICENNNSFFQKIFLLFIETTNQSLNLLQVSLEQKDIVAINKEAHRLKSACSNMGAIKMASLCESLEKIDDLLLAQELIYDLSSELNCVKKEIQLRLGLQEVEI